MPRSPRRSSLSPEEFRDATGVSRETMERLHAYAALLVKWQDKINLVSRGSLGDFWRRHMLDSAQLLPLARGARTWVDLGSGAGFPGLVLAIMGAPEMRLIESDERKCAFLREAARITGTSIAVHHGRIEDGPPSPVDVVVARACAPLPRLLAYAERFVGPNTLCLFLKGQDIEKELTETTKCWITTYDRLNSVSDPAGTILRLKEFARARP